MVFRLIFRYLVNNHQLIDRLAESKPIRRAAQLTAYLFFRSRGAIEEAVKKDFGKKLQQDAVNSGDKVKSFTHTFSNEIKKGFSDLNEELKRRNK